MDKERKSVLIFTIVAISAGFVSSEFNANVGTILGFSILAATTYLLMKTFDEKFKWFFGNGLIIYIFLWLISWILVSGV